MRNRDDRTITIEDAEIIYCNFKGRETRYNREGDRNFSVKIEDPKFARKLLDDGWNVRELKPREGDDPSELAWHLPVAVGFNFAPPKMVLMTTKNKTVIPEQLCGLFDDIEFQLVDLVIRPYEWSVSGNTGIKAYLKTMYVVQFEDPLDLKYANWGEEQPELEAAPAVTIIEGDWR